MASIRKKELDNGVSWQVRWRDPDNKSKAKNFRTAKEARAFAASVETQMNRGDYHDPSAGKVTFKAYAEEWLSIQTTNPTTREANKHRLNNHIYPHIGDVPLRALTPTRIQALVKTLENTPAGTPKAPKPGEKAAPPRMLAASTIRGILMTLTAVLNAAVADDKITRNPAASGTVRAPRVQRRKVVPWTVEQVQGVRANLPERFGVLVTLAAGCGLRQGELFGLAVEDVDFLKGTVHVRRQVKIIGSRLVFGLPKGDKVRDVPLPSSVRDELAAYLANYPARPCSLPWGDVNGQPQTFNLIVTSRERKPMNRNYFNKFVLKPAVESAGLEPNRDNMTHALRHWYASVLLDAGESIKTVAHNLGHEDAGFTLRTYTHLMPSSDERTRKAVDSAFAAKPTASGVDSVWTPGDSEAAN
ncbi:tyrosine-type recombinase/integrase [Marmoricola sp. RAF53]|uniref:tyrosine-type recombinase/integrase n=1 Tax=Marmoricola sp. RAF53 TaxID=3233059 RepID=UPI003F99EA11